MNRKRVVGLIGGIGSGKSLVAEAFARHGARVISGDQLGHEALMQLPIKEQVVRRWGKDILDEQGQIVRRRLAALVFADPAELRALEALVFPWIERRIQEEIAAAQADPKVAFIVLDAAVMLEAGWNKVCDWLVYIDVPAEVRLRRLEQQRGWRAKEVTEREQAQMPLTLKKSRAAYTVDNSGSPEQTQQQVDQLVKRLGLSTPER
jgi:dephospho-CoA kinase